MITYSEVYIYSDQPTTCPKCGSRSEVLLKLAHINDKTEVYLCARESCGNAFVMQYDKEFDNSPLL